MWKLVPQQEKDQELLSCIEEKVQIKSSPKLQSLVAFAEFSARDWELLCDGDVRKALLSFLISEHFTDVRQQRLLLT